MKRTISVVLSAMLLIAVLCSCSSEKKTVEEIYFEETTITIAKGGERALEVSFTPSDSSTSVDYSSSKLQVARIEDGRVIGINPGEAVITAKTASGLTASCTVIVETSSVESISLNKKSAVINQGKTIKLVVEPTPSDSTVGTVRWTSEKAAIASVDRDGNVTGNTPGTTTITCVANDSLEATCQITVNAAATQPPDATKPTTSAKKSESKSSKAKDVNAPTELFPNSSTSRLSDIVIRDTFARQTTSPISGSYAQDAVNEIYARHGYVFKSKALSDHFKQFDWYTPDSGFKLSDLNEVESYNVRLLQQY